MTKDERYIGVKKLIESGHITEFKQIFTYLPKTVMAQDLGTNNNRMTKLIERTQDFTLEELNRIGDLIDISFDSVNMLASNQYKRSKYFKRK
jgi:plasmid maintenance system antidote protein VapI